MRRHTTLLLALLLSGASAQPPNHISSTTGFLRTGNDLTFCLDQQNPIWRFERDVAQALARALGRKADFHIHRKPHTDPDAIAQPIGRAELMRLFAHRCDVYVGLIGSTTPAFDYPADEQMYATRPYLKMQYVFVSRDRKINSLSRLPKNTPLSLETRGLPGYFMHTTRKGRFTDRPVTTAARLVNDLRTGRAKAGIVFAPQLYGRIDDPAKEGLHIAPVKELPSMSWYVIAGVRRDRPTLRQQLDGAIDRLVKRGEITKLLEKHGLSNPYIASATLRDKRPQSESFDDDD